jgi:hypothetical protein
MNNLEDINENSEDDGYINEMHLDYDLNIKKSIKLENSSSSCYLS